MAVEALEGDGHGVGGEALHLELAAAASIHGVGGDGAEVGHVEVVGAAADLFVGSEGEADAAVRDLGVGDEILRSAHDLCDAGLVVGAEQGGAGGGDDRASNLLE